MNPNQMDERRLLSILKQEESDASSYYQSQLAHAQTEAMERYLGQPYGDEIEGMPKVVSGDVEDTVNTIMPHIMRMFLAPEDLISVEDDLGENVEVEQQAAKYLEHIFFKENDGKSVLHDFVFDGLLQRIGIVSVCYEEPKPGVPKEYHNITPERYQQFAGSPEYEILEAAENEPDELGQITANIKVQKTPKVGNFKVEAVAPEEFSIATRSKSIADADYHRRKQSVFLADLVQAFPEKRDDLISDEGHAADDQVEDLDSDERRQARFEDENYDFNDYSHEKEREKVDLLTEWIRIDYDGDGVVELRQVKRVGNTILENIQVDRSELIEWSPIRVAHRAVGRSVTDQIEELTKIKTALIRFNIRNLEQVLSPRTFIRTQDEDVIDQILERDVGSVVPVSGNPREVIYESMTPDVGPSVYNALQYFDQRVEQASGVMRHAQGNKDEGITETADGIRRLQAAANARVELIGLWAIDGLERVIKAILDLVAAHQDQPKIIRVSGKPMPIDPRGWTEDMTVTVNAGRAAETAEDELQKLSLISQKQEQILMQAPNNPIVGLENYAQTLQDMTRKAGIKTPERHFKLPPKGYDEAKAKEAAQAGPQQDPKVIEAQEKAKLREAEANHEARMQQVEFNHKRQMEEFDKQAAIRVKEAQIQAELELAKVQEAIRERIKLVEIEADNQIQMLRIKREDDLARERMAREFELEEKRQEDQKEIAKSAVAAKANGSNGSGYKPGGALHK